MTNFITFGRSGEKEWTLSTLSVFSGHRNSLTSTNEKSFKIKSRTFILLESIVKLFYSQNTNLLPPKPKSTFRHLKQGIQDFHRKYVLVPADKAANNVVVV